MKVERKKAIFHSKYNTYFKYFKDENLWKFKRKVKLMEIKMLHVNWLYKFKY